MSELTETAQVYRHATYVNIGGAAKRPIVSLWCADCLVTVQDFDQNNPWDDMRQAVDEHCSRMSDRERYRRDAGLSTPPTATSDPAGTSEQEASS